MRMKTVCCCLLLVSILPLTPIRGAEPLDVANSYARIVADYERIIVFTRNAADRAAAGRLARDAYRNLIHEAANAKNLNAADLHALGQCYEAIGDTQKANAFYARSLTAEPVARTHLSLVRTNINHNLKAAEQHFAKAVQLDPTHPDLNQFRLSLAAAHQLNRNWKGSEKYLNHLLKYTKTIADRSPENTRLKAGQIAVQKQLDRVRRFDQMTSKTAPPVKVKHWAQGAPTQLSDLKGKVVLLDFCAMWAKPSRERMEFLKSVQNNHKNDDLEIVGMTLAYKHQYDAATDKVNRKDELTAEEEIAGIADFAKKHNIPWRLGMVDRDVVEEYAVSTLPHTVVINKDGTVAAILFGGKQANEDLNQILKQLLK